MDAQKSLTEDWGLWALVGLALLLSGGYYGWLQFFQSQDDSPAWIFNGVKERSVKKVALLENEQSTWQVEQQSQSWQLTTPSGVQIDRASVNRLIQSLLELSPTHRFKARPGEDYGTARSGPYLSIHTRNREHRLYFGGERPTGGGKYLVYGPDSGDRTVFVVPKQDFDALNQSLYDLRRKDLFATSLNAVETLSLKGPSEDVTYRRQADGWTVSGDTLNDTRTESLEGDLRTFLFLTAEQFHDTRPERMGNTGASVSFETGDETVALEIGRGRDGRRLVARSGGWPVVSVGQDPVKLLADLPERPKEWPEPVESDGEQPASTSQSPGKMPDFGNIEQP